jgi:hypothetical protein
MKPMRASVFKIKAGRCDPHFCAIWGTALDNCSSVWREALYNSKNSAR